MRLQNTSRLGCVLYFLFVVPDVGGTEPRLWSSAACYLHTGITDANPLERQERSKLFSKRLWSQCFPTATHKTKTVEPWPHSIHCHPLGWYCPACLPLCSSGLASLSPIQQVGQASRILRDSVYSLSYCWCVMEEPFPSETQTLLCPVAIRTTVYFPPKSVNVWVKRKLRLELSRKDCSPTLGHKSCSVIARSSFYTILGMLMNL